MLSVEVGAVDVERATVTVHLSETSRLILTVEQQKATRENPRGWRQYVLYTRWQRRPSSRHVWGGDSVEHHVLGYVLLDDMDGTMRPGPQHGQPEAPPFAMAPTALGEVT